MSATTITALCISGIFLIACETIVPGGVVGTIGFILALIGVVGSFKFGLVTGFAVLLVVLLGGLLSVCFMLKLLPHSKHGKVLCLSEDQKGFTAAGDEAPAKVGDIGVTLTMLRPAGVIETDGKRVDVVTQGNYTSPDKKVKVIDVKGSRVVVEEISE